jgi:hypothetical protein
MPSQAAAKSDRQTPKIVVQTEVVFFQCAGTALRRTKRGSGVDSARRKTPRADKAPTLVVANHPDRNERRSQHPFPTSWAIFTGDRPIIGSTKRRLVLDRAVVAQNTSLRVSSPDRMACLDRPPHPVLSPWRHRLDLGFGTWEAPDSGAVPGQTKGHWSSPKFILSSPRSRCPRPKTGSLSR